MSLDTGSGIATYGRNLLASLNAIGVKTSVLWAPQGPIAKNPTMNEVAAADLVRGGRKMKTSERWIYTWRAQWGLEATGVRRTGRIIRRQLDDATDDIATDWLCRDVFHTSTRAFQRYGHMTPLSFEFRTDTPRPDVAHWTSTLPLYAKHCFNIHSVHDIIPLRMPFSTLERKDKYFALLNAIARKSDHIIVVSESTKTDLMRFFSISESRITNTYQSVNPLYASAVDNEAAARMLEDVFGVPWKGYFLHYATVEPKKNLGRLVEAYVRSGSTTPLLIVGAQGWAHEPETALLRAIEQYGASADRIRQYGYLPTNVLADLVRGAKAALFPSLYEGFGLPVLEAMSAGTAVLTSNTGALIEVASDAALLVDPLSIESISKALRALDNDVGMVDDLVARGVVQVDQFSPDRYQKRLHNLYNSLGLSTG